MALIQFFMLVVLFSIGLSIGQIAENTKHCDMQQQQMK